MMKMPGSPSYLEKVESLEVLNYEIRSCERCPLWKTREHALPGEGTIQSRIMLVALSPGVKENHANRMFVGPSGQVLEKLFHAAGIHRERMYMTNLVKCMLPGNRKPQSFEIERCSVFLEAELSIIQPEFIVPLGHYAAQAVLNRYPSGPMVPGKADNRILFGKLLERNGQKIYPLSHPASLLYHPSNEADTIEKYKMLKAFL